MAFDRQALTSGQASDKVPAEAPAVEHSDLAPVDLLRTPSTRSAVGLASAQGQTRNPRWLPLGIAALLSALLLCGVMLIPLGPTLSSALTQWRFVLSDLASSHPASPTTSVPTAFQDTLRQGNVSRWPESADQCFFAEDGYHVKGGAICLAPLLATANSELTVTVRFLAGQPEQSVGVFFRMQDQDNLYGVSLTHSGAWLMGKKVDGEFTILANDEHAGAMRTGLTAANTLQLVLRGDDFTLSLNTIVVGSVTDKTFAYGFVGLFAVPGAEAVFSDLSAVTDQ
jgi:hypothetical protein